MGKRFWSLALSMALVGGVFSAIPGRAQEAPPATVPAVVNIEDPMGDANYINDQGAGAPLPGDTVLPASAGTVSDILKAWFTSDASTVSAHILTKAAPPASTPLIFHVRVDPGSGTDCLWFRASFPSAVQGQEDPVVAKKATLRDTCATALGIQDGELKVEKTAEANGVITMTFPRSIHPAFAEGSILKAPTADSRNFPGGVVTAPQIDDTKPGTDFTVTSGPSGGAGTPAEPTEPPGKNDPPGSDKAKKKGCAKGKGQKKGACPGKKKPKPPAGTCAPYVPGEMGKDAETTVVTDAATEEKPIEVDVPLGPATGSYGSDRTTRMKHNVQVDSAAAEAGLWIRLESPPLDDPDLYVYWPEGGKPAAVVGGFNPLLVGGPLPNPANNATITSLNGQGQGGHSEFTAEQVDGLKTSDCQGWTLDLVNWAGRGGYTLKLWLADAKNDPAPPADESARLDLYEFLMSF